jgi:hypothetical protein
MSVTGTRSAGVQRLTREQIVQMGRGAAQPWAFVPICRQALAIAPGDAELRFLCAANLARLGLRTLAIEELALLPTPAQSAATDLRAACQTLPDDRISAELVRETCRGNIDALAARGTQLDPFFQPWADQALRDEWFRTLDGNIVRQRRGGDWVLFGDHRGAAARFAAQHLTPPPPAQAHSPAALYTLEGLNPPWILLELARCTPRQRDGFWPRIAIVQADPMEMLDGLAHTDLRQVLGEARLEFYIGSDAGVRLAGEMRNRAAFQISGPCIPLLSTRRATEPPAATILEQARADQLRMHEQLVAQVQQIYAGRDAPWWLTRFAQALGGAAPPLRILIPTTRYSTYVQYASSDLAESLRQRGMEVHILIEPDDHTRLSTISYLRLLAECQPDIIVMINYFRANLGNWLIDELPVVCWIQDCMPHLFDAKIGAAQHELDFIVGHLHEELFSRFGFPRTRTLAFPVVVSAHKFHDAPVAPAARQCHQCEIAFVSHHGEPPTQMHARLVREAGNAATAEVLERLYPAVLQAASDAMGTDSAGRGGPERVKEVVRWALRESTGDEPADAQVLQLHQQYAMPMAERVLRHQAAHWTAQVARRRSWGFHLYGRGWAAVPELAEFARGEAAHGEALRAIYQCAAVQLHVSATALVHQRIMECALSGGLPVCRLTWQGLESIAAGALWLARAEGLPADADLPAMLDAAQLAPVIALLEQLGVDPAGILRSAARSDESRGHAPFGPERRADWVYGDLAQLSFRSAEELEALVVRALHQPAWRGDAIAGMAARVRQRLTHDAFIQRMLTLISTPTS